MRIAFVYDTVYPETKGGVERRVWEIARHLVGLGHTVELLVPRMWQGPPIVEREGVLLRGVCPGGDLYRRSGRRSVLQSLRHAVGVYRTLRRVGYDVVDCQVPAHPAVLAVRLASRGKRNVKQVITWHEAWGDHWITEYGLAGRVGRFVERVVARTPARHLSVSSSTEAELASLGTVSGRVVEAGVDLTAIDVVVPRPEADVLHVGRLVPSKNVSLLLHSIAALVTEGLSPRVVIVGDGPDRPHLESLVSELDLDHLVDFRGAMDRWEDVIALVKGARVLALPSLREGFGLIALEASACGTPVVTVDHHRNAARDLMVAGETGFVVPPTSGEFADALRQVLQDDDLREKLGRTARERVVSGRWVDVAEATLAVYGKVPA